MSALTVQERVVLAGLEGDYSSQKKLNRALKKPEYISNQISYNMQMLFDAIHRIAAKQLKESASVQSTRWSSGDRFVVYLNEYGRMVDMEHTKSKTRLSDESQESLEKALKDTATVNINSGRLFKVEIDDEQTMKLNKVGLAVFRATKNLLESIEKPFATLRNIRNLDKFNSWLSQQTNASEGSLIIGSKEKNCIIS